MFLCMIEYYNNFTPKTFIEKEVMNKTKNFMRVIYFMYEE